MHTTAGVARAMIPLIYTADKPVVVAVMGERLIQEAVEHFRSARVPEYRFPERAATALAILTRRAEFLVREEGAPVCREDVQPEQAQVFLEEAGATGRAMAGLMDAYGIRTPASALVQCREEAVACAEAIGFPVALKIVSPDIAHKSDVEGVVLDLADGDAVATAYERLVGRVTKRAPQASITGVEVQQMIPAGQEVIVGVIRDPQFGPVVMFGSGGVEVEGLKDVEFSLAPLTEAAAEGLLARTWAGRRLEGYRNIPPADREAVLDVLYRLGQLADDFPDVAEIEINPLRVLAPGEGAFAVDVRARIDTV